MSATAIHLASRVVSSRVLSTVGVCAVLLASTGCDRIAQRTGSSGELEWARAALERNPQLEVVATDPNTRVFTVRNRNTGDVQAVNLDELAAAPVEQLKAAASQAAQAAQPQPQAPAATTAQAQQPTPATTTARTQPQAPASATLQATVPSHGAPATPQTREQTTRTPEGAAATPEQSRTSTDGNYKIERTNGQLRVSGPGVSIVSTGDTAQSSPAGEGRLVPSEPIICEGRRMMHLDSRGVSVDGDAIIARGGCALYITNSRIVASGTAIVVEDATVHISNSHIEGANGSFDASERARVFVRGSTFEGIPRRAEFSMVQDQGGNRWR